MRMSSSDYREPTDDELWAQPPVTSDASAAPGGLAPTQQPKPPASKPPASQPPAPQQQTDWSVFILAIVSLTLGVPLTAISSNAGGMAGLLVAWVSIVLINVVYALSRRRK